MCGALPLKGYGMSEQGARPVATAWVMTAAAVIYALAAICLPLPTMMMGMLWPVFIALVTVREGLRWGLLVSIAALLLTLPLATPAMGAFFVLSFAPTGLAIGGLFRRRADTLRALTGGVLASLGGKGAAVLMMFLLFGLNPFAIDFSTASEAVNETLAVYRSLGIDEARLEQTRAMSMQALESFALVLPALFLGGSVIEAAACFVVLRNVLVRLGIPAAPFPAFTEWRVFLSVRVLADRPLLGDDTRHHPAVPGGAQRISDRHTCGACAGALVPAVHDEAVRCRLVCAPARLHHHLGERTGDADSDMDGIVRYCL